MGRVWGKVQVRVRVSVRVRVPVGIGLGAIPRDVEARLHAAIISI